MSRVRLLHVVLVLGVTAACGEEPAGSGAAGLDVEAAAPARLAGAARGHNVLLVTLDTTRADRLGCYGYTAAGTTNLDRLAAEGVRVERALAVAPITLPSHASILTGQWPTEHGVHDNGLFKVPESAPLLSTILKREGYTTAAFVSAYVLDAVYGIGRDFDTFDDRMSSDGGRGLGELERPAERTVAAAVQWLAQAPPEPWFLWLHFYDPHLPHEPPPPFDQRADRYDGEVAYMDHHLGQFLNTYDAEGRLDRTLLVVTADHGEGLGEHGETSHGIFVYDSTMRVPLILRHPAFGAGRRVDGQVSLVDVAPTVLEALGVTDDTPRGGRSFLAALDLEQPVTWRPALLENHLAYYSYGVAPVEGISDGTLKSIRVPQPELYDWRADPAELDNLLESRAADVARLQDLWLEVRGEVDPARQLPNREVSDEETARLAELGYLQQDAGADVLLDPKDFVRIQALHQQVNDHAAAGRMGDAERLLREILERCPRDTESLRALGRLCLRRGDRREGIELFQRALELRSDDWVTALELADAYQEQGRSRKALAHYQRALRYDPSNVRAALTGAAIALELDEPARAAELLELVEGRRLSVEDFDALEELRRQLEAAEEDSRP